MRRTANTASGLYTPKKLHRQLNELNEAWHALRASPRDWQKQADVKLKTQHLLRSIVLGHRGAASAGARARALGR